jgi:hypothetical protein
MSLALTTTYENSYFRRSIPPFCETQGRVGRGNIPVWSVAWWAVRVYPHWGKVGKSSFL